MKQVVLITGVIFFIALILFFNLYLSQQGSSIQLKDKYTKVILENFELTSEIIELRMQLFRSMEKNGNTTNNTPQVHKEIKENPQHEVWHSFGRDEHFATCDKDYGFSLVKDWRSKSEEYSISSGNSFKETKVFCHNIRQRFHRFVSFFFQFFSEEMIIFVILIIYIFLQVFKVGIVEKIKIYGSPVAFNWNSVHS
jgi:hypothetical protein